MPRVVVRQCTDSFLTEVKERNPHCAAGNARQAKIISLIRQKTAHLVLDSMMRQLSDDAFLATTAQLTSSCMCIEYVVLGTDQNGPSPKRPQCRSEMAH